MIKLICQQTGEVIEPKLIELKPELPIYTKGFIAGLEAGYQLAVLIGAFAVKVMK